MDKMLLVSLFQNVAKLLKSVEPNLKNKTITFIPTASRVERFSFFVNIGKWQLKRLGLVIDVLDVATEDISTIKKKLEGNDYIYISGGNSFYLMQELKRSGADAILIQEIRKGKLYIGESAGAIIMAQDIGYSAIMDDPEKAPDLADHKGLNLVDFYVVPHLRNRELGKAAALIVEKYSSDIALKVISDRQAIHVHGDMVEILNN